MASRWKKLRRNRLAVAGTVIAGGVLVAGLLGPAVIPLDPMETNLAGRLSGPSTSHWLGQDELGRDMLSRLVCGARVSLIVGLSSVAFSLAIGILFGATAGFFGGFVDEVIMRVIDVLLAFPGLLLAIALTAVLGPSLVNIVLALSILGWVGYARIVRAQFLKIREQDYVAAAAALGAGRFRIASRHILPNIWAPVLVQATFGIATAILAEASLSFLGLGTQGMPSWGGMLSDGIDFLRSAPRLSILPGLALMAAVLGFNFLGDGLRDALDPRLTLGPSSVPEEGSRMRGRVPGRER